MIQGWSLMKDYKNCPQGRLLSEGFIPFFVYEYDYGVKLVYKPEENHPLFRGFNQDLIYNCRNGTLKSPHLKNISDTFLLYNSEKKIDLFGVSKKKKKKFEIKKKNLKY